MKEIEVKTIDNEVLFTLSKQIISQIPLVKYYQSLIMNKMQLTYPDPQAGNKYAMHPSGTNKARSRQPRARISGSQLRVLAVPNAVKGRIAYHFRTTKKILFMNKKERQLAINTILYQALLYHKTYIFDDQKHIFTKTKDLYNFFVSNIPLFLERYKLQRNRYYTAYAKNVVLVHDTENLYDLTKNMQSVRSINIKNPEYLELILKSNSKHIIIFTKKAMSLVKQKLQKWIITKV